MSWSKMAALTLLSAALLSGCTVSERKNENRPPAQLTASVVVKPHTITVTPAEIGAGPIKLIVSNQSGSDIVAQLEGDQTLRKTSTLGDLDTDEIKETLKTGVYTIGVSGDDRLEPATLTVGSKRPTSQNDLLLP